MSKQKHIAIKASKKSISSMILSILMLLSVIPLHSSTIFAESTKKTVMNGTGNIQKTDSIWFGIRGKDLTGAGSEIQWRVLDTNTNIGEDGIFLLSEKLIGKSDFSKGWKASRKWQGSDAQKWCKDFSGENGDNSLKSLSDQELAAIKPTTESNPGKIAPDVPFHPKEKYALKEDKVFFPSVGEAGKYFQTDDERIAYDGNNPGEWWLRSPHKSLIKTVRIVKQNGGISNSNVRNELSVRPAFNLDTTKVLFTSPAVDGKQSNAAGDALKAVEDTDTTEWKLTLIDRNRTFQLDTDNGEKVTIAGNILTIPYKDATTGTNEYISAVVEKNGSITYYGRLKAVENSNTDKNGEVTVQLPADFDKTTDTLYLINEQLNGDKKTDYSSAKIEVEIPAQQPPQPTEYTVTMENDGNGKSMANPTKAKQGDIISINAEANKGFKFKKWQALKGVPGTSGQVHFDEGAENTAFIMPESDVTIKAIFGKLYKIDVKSNNSQYGTAKATVDGVVGDIEEEIAGTKITLKATPNSGSGYTFDKWEVVSGNIQLTDASSANTTFTMPDNDVEIKAYFKGQQPPQPTQHKIKLTDDGNGTAKSMVGGVQVTETEQGKEVTITATAKNGYTFDKWEVVSGNIQLTDASSANITFTMPDNDVEIKAYFKGQQPPQPTQHKIKLTDDGNGTAKSMVGGVQVTETEQGKEVTITATAKNGYTFDKWEVVSGNIQLTDASSANTTFTMPDNDVEIKAYFKGQQPPQPTQHKIKLTDDGNGTAKSMVGGVQVTETEQGKEVTITATAKNGYTFDKWEVVSGNIQLTDASSANTTFTMPDNDVEIKAYFKGQQPPQPTQHKIKLTDDGNGTAKSMVGGVQVTETEQGKEVTITATAKNGYTFDKWEVVSGNIQLTDASSANITFTMPDNDVEIKAYFKGQQPPQPTQHKIKLTDDGNGTAKSMVGGVQVTETEQGKEVTITATAKNGYTFDKWEVVSGNIQLTDASSANTTFTMPDNDVEIKAYFKGQQPPQPTQHKIKLTDDGNGTAKSMVGGVQVTETEQGKEVTITATAKNGYTFDKWEVVSGNIQLTDASSANTTFTMPDNDVEIKAYFKGQQPPQPTQHKIKLTDDGNGTAKSMVGGVQVTETEQGKEVTITATAKNGYTFDKWEVVSGNIQLTDASSANTTFTMPDNDVEIKAYFKGQQPPQPTQHKIKLTDDGNGTAKSMVGGVQVTETEQGKEVTITATAKNGYTFDKWEVVSGNIQLTDASSANTTFTMPDNDVEIKAYFKGQQPPQPTKYKIKLTDDGNGTAKSMVGGVQVTEAEQGKKVTITAMPDRGYKFDEWRVLSGGIRLRDEDSATTTFTMPNRDVEIKAYFKKKSSGGSSHDTEYYNITTKTDKHGTVEARSKAREGTEVSVTVSPDKGYKLDEITVTDRRGRDIKIKETNRENRYKFTMPARDVTVEATFKQIKQEQPSKPTTPPTIPPTNNNKPTENNIIKKQQTTVFTIGSNIMTVITDGKATQTTIDAKPFLSQGRVMIPVRYAAESLGMQVEWNKQTQTVVLKDRENTVMIPIKTNKIIVGNQEYTSDVTPILKNGRTYLTISNIAKALRMRAGQDVRWDNKTKQVTIIKEVEVR